MSFKEVFPFPYLICFLWSKRVRELDVPFVIRFLKWFFCFFGHGSFHFVFLYSPILECFDLFMICKVSSNNPKKNLHKSKIFKRNPSKIFKARLHDDKPLHLSLVSMVNIDFIMEIFMKPRANSIKIGVKAWDFHMFLLAFHNDLDNTKKYIRWLIWLGTNNGSQAHTYPLWPTFLHYIILSTQYIL